MFFEYNNFNVSVECCVAMLYLKQKFKYHASITLKFIKDHSSFLFASCAELVWYKFKIYLKLKLI